MLAHTIGVEEVHTALFSPGQIHLGGGTMNLILWGKRITLVHRSCFMRNRCTFSTVMKVFE